MRTRLGVAPVELMVNGSSWVGSSDEIDSRFPNFEIAVKEYDVRNIAFGVHGDGFNGDQLAAFEAGSVDWTGDDNARPCLCAVVSDRHRGGGVGRINLEQVAGNSKPRIGIR